MRIFLLILINIIILFFSRFQLYAQEDSCITVAKIKNTIEDYINNSNKKIYKKKFIKIFAESNKYKSDCYFFADVKNINLYFYLGDSVLLKRVKTDERAMKLLIDLYLLNRKKVEISQYYSTRVIPKAAVENTELFVRVLAKKTEREANKCISSLEGILSKYDKEKIRKELKKIQKRKYLPIVNKIEEKLQ